MRHVLITGATGFLGRHIAGAWRAADAEVCSLGRRPGVDDIVSDLAVGLPDLAGRRFDTVIHCAGKAHIVPKTEKDAEDLFRVNVEGTRNLLSAFDAAANLPDRIVLISTIAVYGLSSGVDVDENFVTAARTPYASSKVEAEELVRRWADGHGISHFILRLPLVVGSGPPGNLGEMAAGIKRGTYVRIRNNFARKSMVLAEDVGHMTLALGSESGTYNLADGRDHELFQIEEAIAASLGKAIPWSIPKGIAKLLARIGDAIPLPIDTERFVKLTSTLTFSSDLAVEKLAWKPRSCLEFIRDGGLFYESGPVSNGGSLNV